MATKTVKKSEAFFTSGGAELDLTRTPVHAGPYDSIEVVDEESGTAEVFRVTSGETKGNPNPRAIKSGTKKVETEPEPEPEPAPASAPAPSRPAPSGPSPEQIQSLIEELRIPRITDESVQQVAEAEAAELTEGVDRADTILTGPQGAPKTGEVSRPSLSAPSLLTESADESTKKKKKDKLGA